MGTGQLTRVTTALGTAAATPLNRDEGLAEGEHRRQRAAALALIEGRQFFGLTVADARIADARLRRRCYR
jgi:hypothetical protein